MVFITFLAVSKKKLHYLYREGEREREGREEREKERERESGRRREKARKKSGRKEGIPDWY